ncbi:MAG: hypothetical protein WAL90_10970 [Desulfobacterales bacterium]
METRNKKIKMVLQPPWLAYILPLAATSILLGCLLAAPLAAIID